MELALKCGYDADGRLATVHAQGYGFQYGYEPNSSPDRVKTVTAPFVKQTEFTYDLGRDAIARVVNRVGFKLDQAFSEFADSSLDLTADLSFTPDFALSQDF